MEDPFIVESARVRAMVAESLRAWWSELPRDGELELVEPDAPLALMGCVRTRRGELIAEFQARAGSTNLLIGREGKLCSFDGGTPEQQVERLVGGIAALTCQAARGE